MPARHDDREFKVSGRIGLYREAAVQDYRDVGCTGLAGEYPCCMVFAELVGSDWEYTCTCYVPCTQGVTTIESWSFE